MGHAPYLAQEFYLEYGDFDCWVTVPSTMLVAGGGELVNLEEVLTAAQRARLDKARASNATVMIRSPAEIKDPASRPKRDGTLTWHYRDEGHARRRLQRVSRLRLGCGAHQSARRQGLARHVLLSGREPGEGSLGPLHRIL